MFIHFVSNEFKLLEPLLKYSQNAIRSFD